MIKIINTIYDYFFQTPPPPLHRVGIESRVHHSNHTNYYYYYYILYAYAYAYARQRIGTNCSLPTNLPTCTRSHYYYDYHRYNNVLPPVPRNIKLVTHTRCGSAPFSGARLRRPAAGRHPHVRDALIVAGTHICVISNNINMYSVALMHYRLDARCVVVYPRRRETRCQGWSRRVPCGNRRRRGYSFFSAERRASLPPHQSIRSSCPAGLTADTVDTAPPLDRILITLLLLLYGCFPVSQQSTSSPRTPPQQPMATAMSSRRRRHPARR